MSYHWDIDTGNFTYIPADDDAEPKRKTERKTRETKKEFKDKEDVF